MLGVFDISCVIVHEAVIVDARIVSFRSAEGAGVDEFLCGGIPVTYVKGVSAFGVFTV